MNQEEQKKNKKITIKSIIMILLIISLGFIGINQYLEFLYKVRLIETPCNLCKQVIKEQEPSRVACIDACLTLEKKLYPQPNGDLKDDLGNCYNINMQKVKCKNAFNISSFNISNIR